MGSKYSFHLQLPTELEERVKQACDERLISPNVLITKAIEDFLDRLIPLHEMTYDWYKRREQRGKD